MQRLENRGRRVSDIADVAGIGVAMSSGQQKNGRPKARHRLRRRDLTVLIGQGVRRFHDDGVASRRSSKEGKTPSACDRRLFGNGQITLIRVAVGEVENLKI